MATSSTSHQLLRGPNGEALPQEYTYLLVRNIRHIGAWHLITDQHESNALRQAYTQENPGRDCIPFARGGEDGDDIAGFIIESGPTGANVCVPKVSLSHLSYTGLPSYQSPNSTPILRSHLSVWEWLSKIVVEDLKTECESFTPEDLLEEWARDRTE